MALQQSKKIWESLSLPEPENQARPATLEQLLVLLIRESARRIVHVVNGMAALVSRAPRSLGIALTSISHQLLGIAATLKVIYIFFIIIVCCTEIIIREIFTILLLFNR